jgi:poly-gamma-glutamate synthesis protein (capsule biosynthesis protein)
MIRLSRIVLVPLVWLFAALPAAPASAADEQPGSVSLVFVGDVMLDGGPGHVVTSGRDPFEALTQIVKPADLVIGNLECAITKAGHAVDKPYTFKGTRAALGLLKQHFAAVSLANNHSGDWGKAGFASELSLLRDAGIRWFGGGASIDEARRPLVLETGGRRIALLGYNDFPPRDFAAGPHTPGTAWLVEKEVIQDVRAARADGADLVILFLHWGEELEEEPTPEQRALAGRLIDAGADAVIGSHPHVMQPVEWHRGKPIVYSLGNFVFDYFPGDPPEWTGLIVRLTFRPDAEPTLEQIRVVLDAAGVPHLSGS